MDPYIYTSRNGVHIIDLVQTAQLMEEAYTYMRSAAEQGKKFLFVGTKQLGLWRKKPPVVVLTINQRWLGGMLVDDDQDACDRLKDLERREAEHLICCRKKKLLCYAGRWRNSRNTGRYQNDAESARCSSDCRSAAGV